MSKKTEGKGGAFVLRNNMARHTTLTFIQAILVN
jgi:hypothetical protein